jgi:tyrosine-protein phosphatase SIW14
MKKQIFIIVFLFSLLSQAFIANERQVESGITRGGRPGLSDLAEFKTIINLENQFKYVKAEKANAEEQGIQFISSPMDPSAVPEEQEINKLIAIMKNKKNQPIFIHCFHGEDRTGLVVGVYRVVVDGWTPQRAYQEMLDMGFHPRYTGMKNYFFSQMQNP